MVVWDPQGFRRFEGPQRIHWTKKDLPRVSKDLPRIKEVPEGSEGSRYGKMDLKGSLGFEMDH